MILYRFARLLQALGLILVPIAVAGNLAEIAEARTALSLKESLMLSGLGMLSFGVGYFLQQQVKPSG